MARRKSDRRDSLSSYPFDSGEVNRTHHRMVTGTVFDDRGYTTKKSKRPYNGGFSNGWL